MSNYLNEASEIIPGRLWLSGKKPALDTKWLKSKNIQVVFNCSKDIPFAYGPSKHYRVPVHDNLEDDEIDNMRKWSPEIVYKLLREYREGNNILVHCAAGMQRSAAVVLMFLMTEWRQPQNKIVPFMRNKRPIVFRPSMNFEPAVEWYEIWFFSQIIKNK